MVPATACGGAAVLSFGQDAPIAFGMASPGHVSTTQIIAVGENQTRMEVTPEQLGIKAIQVNSYLEALGVLVVHKAGLDPNSLRPNILSLNQLKSY